MTLMMIWVVIMFFGEISKDHKLNHQESRFGAILMLFLS